MIEIKGVYGKAKVFADELEQSAEGQIKTLCEEPKEPGRKKYV